MKVDDYFPPFPGISGHFPPFPTFSHFIFILWPSGAWNQGGEMRSPDTRPEAHGRSLGRSGIRPYRAAAGAEFCGKKCGLLRESPRSFTKVRTDQVRGYAMLRIVTGKSLF